MKDTGIKFETLRKGFNFKKAFIGLVVIVAIGSVIILKGSKANYTYEQIIPFAEGEVRIRKADLNLMAVNVQKTKGCTTKDTCYESTKDVPTSGYKINEENSYCTVDNGTKDVEDKTIPMEYKNGKVYIGVNKKGTRCYIYLDIKEYDCAGPACETIMVNKTILTRAAGTFGNTITGDKTGTIYQSADESQYDDFGKVYYFAGNPTDNWVKFGKVGSSDIYWRIIRINGDGSIRMIYSGTGSAATTGTDTQITVEGKNTSAFNSSENYNAYVGYMYGTPGSKSYAEEHKNTTPSIIKTVLDNWYNTTTNLSTLSTKLSHTAGFCGDRSSSTDTSTVPAQTGGYGTTITYYGAYYRNVTNKTPSFKCTYKGNDLYTTPEDASQGNKKLTYPIGLITVDEVAFAGGVSGTNNTSFYLYTNQYYWTMSPRYFWYGTAYMFGMSTYGGLDNHNVSFPYGVRPVINLKADVSFTGNGTTSSPYEVS